MRFAVAADTCSRLTSATPTRGKATTNCSTPRPSSRWRCATIFGVVPLRQLIKLHILETDRGRSAAAATFNGRRRPLDNVGLLRALFASTLVDAENRGRDPVALRLRLKGACLVPRQNAALNPRLATAKSTDYTSPKLFARGEG
jgi:hypothetical protein